MRAPCNASARLWNARTRSYLRVSPFPSPHAFPPRLHEVMGPESRRARAVDAVAASPLREIGANRMRRRRRLSPSPPGATRSEAADPARADRSCLEASEEAVVALSPPGATLSESRCEAADPQSTGDGTGLSARRPPPAPDPRAMDNPIRMLPLQSMQETDVVIAHTDTDTGTGTDAGTDKHTN